MSWLRFFAQLHGHVGWLLVASLMHPALLLRAGRGRGLAIVATSLSVLATCSGALLYPSYRVLVKRSLFLDDPRLGWAFERKEHLAFAAASFALLGLVASELANRGSVMKKQLPKAIKILKR